MGEILSPSMNWTVLRALKRIWGEEKGVRTSKQKEAIWLICRDPIFKETEEVFLNGINKVGSTEYSSPRLWFASGNLSLQ